MQLNHINLLKYKVGKCQVWVSSLQDYGAYVCTILGRFSRLRERDQTVASTVEDQLAKNSRFEVEKLQNVKSIQAHEAEHLYD